MATVKDLKATARPKAGKGAARAERRAGRVPGVIYGDGKAPQTISLDRADIRQRIYAGHFLTTLHDLEVDGVKQRVIPRGHAALCLAWLRRIDRPIQLSCLDLGNALVVHLPGEPFVEYQLKAQQLRPDAFVCVAGYGDYGPMYIPTDAAFLQGGYEPTVALAAPCQKGLEGAIGKLLGGG